jgi:hypothetical protein
MLTRLDEPVPVAAGKAPAPASGADFHVVHLYAGRDGRTRLETLDPRQATEHLPYLFKSKATSVAVLRYPAGRKFVWPSTPGVRRLLVQLQGASVVIVDDGHEPGRSYHPLQPGSVVLVEDLGGRGPRGTVFEDEDAIIMQVDLAPTSGAGS